MSKIIGIDLGTTNSAIAVIEGGSAKIIPTAEGRNTFPSIVSYKKGITVGDVAKRQMVLNPKNTVNSVKRFMGQKFNSRQVQDAVKHIAYEIGAGKDGMVTINCNGKKLTPQEVSAQILQKAKTDAETYLGQKVEKAVITVPAYFDDSQRQATKQAGEIAGLKVERIVNEPTAAALAYGLDKKGSSKIAVYDLGGGTFDISILEIGDGVFEVKSTNGDTFLGGDDFDNKVIAWIIDEFKKEFGRDLSKDSQALQRVKDAAEKAKIELSSTMQSEISLPFITQGDDNQPLHLSLSLTRAKLEELTDELIKQTFEPVKKALSDAKTSASEIQNIVLVGGMTRMPKVISEVEKFFGKKPEQGVNPDEVVAIGAAVQAGVIAGDVQDVVLLDVTPLTLGVETLGGIRTPIIKRNTTIPTSGNQIFSTAVDNQTSVEINVLQGEREMAIDNKSLGRFILDGIPMAPRGIPQVEVKFDIDSNGILKVSAQDKTSGKEANITIANSTNLSEEEIEQMKKDAEMHAEDDKKKRELIEVKNQANSVAFEMEKQIKEYGDKISNEEDKKQIEADIKNLKKLASDENVTKEQLDKAIEDSMKSAQKIGEAVQKAQAEQSAQTAEVKTDSQDKKDKEEKEKKTDKKDEEVVEGEVIS